MRLRSQRVFVEAPRELVFEVIAAGGKDIGESEGARLVEFETEWQGRVITTTEQVCLERPSRITYRWVTGPLIDVEEEILFREVTEAGTQLTYRGRFTTPRGALGWLRGAVVVRPIFNRLVREHLEQARNLSEARASRSHIYPRSRQHANG